MPLVAAWLVHLYTGSGFVLAFLSTIAVIDHDYRTAFVYLWVQVVVDATDGTLARMLRVSERIPSFSGTKLDDLVDYLTYVFVPALIVWRGLLVPDAWALTVTGAMLVSSGYGFSREKAKTPDHFFTGFPSYWNIVVFYLFVLGLSPAVNTAILLAFALSVFVPIRYVYPSRTPVWRWSSNVFGVLWGVALLVMNWQYPATSRALVLASLSYPAFYYALSFTLHWRSVAPSARWR
jgi:phosphatidylcholine synthase